MAEIDKVQVGGTSYDITNTKNTAGTTNKTGTKMFLAGATEQSANPQTYSNSNVYIGTDNCLYSGGTKVLTAHQSISGKADKVSSATAGDVATLDANGNLVDSGKTLGKSVPSDAKFTDTTYSQISRGSSAGLAPGLPSGSGTTKYLREDGSWQVPPDTNTWRGIQDNLTSTSTTDSLSAAQGKLLNDKIVVASYTATSESDVKTYLLNRISTMPNGGIESVSFYTNYTTASKIEGNVVWGGSITRYTGDYFSVNLVGNNGMHLDIGYGTGSWYINTTINNLIGYEAKRATTDGIGMLLVSKSGYLLAGAYGTDCWVERTYTSDLGNTYGLICSDYQGNRFIDTSCEVFLIWAKKPG